MNGSDAQQAEPSSSAAPLHFDRRRLLGAAAALPLWLHQHRFGYVAPRGGARTLLVLELAGGNDGLNTVIPVDDPLYAAARPRLSVVRKGAHRLDDGTALHPALPRLHRLVASGRAAVVHGVGYPQPDRSHFRSRDIWQVADPTHRHVTANTTGWLGRAADQLAAAGTVVPGAAIGGLEVPLALRAVRATVPSLRRVEDFQWLSPLAAAPVARGEPVRELVADRAEAGADASLRTFVQDRTQRALRLADDLERALAAYRPRATYPETQLGRDLRLAAQVVTSGFGTRLLHVSTGGYDTHARQLPTHQSLLAQLDAALDAFVADVMAHGRADDVTVLVHSEFGRRVAENASQGTDHGAAAPAFVLLGRVAPGAVGPAPDLQHLDDGDLVATMDFRRLYSDLLRWLEIDPAVVLGDDFESSGVLLPR